MMAPALETAHRYECAATTYPEHAAAVTASTRGQPDHVRTECECGRKRSCSSGA